MFGRLRKMGWMVKNSKGEKDAMLTFSLWAMVIACTKVLVSGVVFHVMGKEVKLGTADALTITALLAPTLGAYVARKHSESMYGPDGIQGTADDPKDEDDAPRGREPKDV